MPPADVKHTLQITDLGVWVGVGSGRRPADVAGRIRMSIGRMPLVRPFGRTAIRGDSGRSLGTRDPDKMSNPETLHELSVAMRGSTSPRMRGDVEDRVDVEVHEFLTLRGLGPIC